MNELFTLPADLEANATAQFDDLVKQGEILYQEARWERVEDGAFTVHHPPVSYLSIAAPKRPLAPTG
jgi:hypothetical protein